MDNTNENAYTVSQDVYVRGKKGKGSVIKIDIKNPVFTYLVEFVDPKTGKWIDRVWCSAKNIDIKPFATKYKS